MLCWNEVDFFSAYINFDNLTMGTDSIFDEMQYG